jgi:biopolymer transport protein ExbB/TolQ
MTDALQNAIAVLTNLFIWPVIALLFIGMAYALYTFGNMIVESFQRKGKPKSIDDLRNPSDYFKNYLGITEWKTQVELEPSASNWQLLDRTEVQLKKRINRVRTWVKLGPTIGLIGTLIPLGSALSSLANNNFKQLAQSGTHSISATVMGLAIGALCMIVASHYERWYAIDLAEVRHAIEKEEASFLNTKS